LDVTQQALIGPPRRARQVRVLERCSGLEAISMESPQDHADIGTAIYYLQRLDPAIRLIRSNGRIVERVNAQFWTDGQE
jgi:hypothetical protein